MPEEQLSAEEELKKATWGYIGVGVLWLSLITSGIALERFGPDQRLSHQPPAGRRQHPAGRERLTQRTGTRTERRQATPGRPDWPRAGDGRSA